MEMYSCKYLRFTIYIYNTFLNKYAHIRAYTRIYAHIFKNMSIFFMKIRAYKHIIFLKNTRILIPSLFIIFYIALTVLQDNEINQMYGYVDTLVACVVITAKGVLLKKWKTI